MNKTVKTVLKITGSVLLTAAGILLICLGSRPEDRDRRIVSCGITVIIWGLMLALTLIPPVRRRPKEIRNAPDAAPVIEDYRNGLTDYKTFMTSISEDLIYYSTPFGDDNKGEKKLFLVTGENGGKYLPVFSSRERIVAFEQKEDRSAFMVMEATYLDILKQTCLINLDNNPVKLGIVIDPGYCDVFVDASDLGITIDRIQGNAPW